MKKVAICTLYGNENYGNKLQNYATQEIIKEYNNMEVLTIRNDLKKNPVQKIKHFIKECIKICLSVFIKKYRKQIIMKREKKKNKEIDTARIKNFEKFDLLINKTDYVENIIKPSSKLNEKFDYFFVGSDQVWNPNFEESSQKIGNFFLLSFADNNKKIAWVASFGIDTLPEKASVSAKQLLESFKAISVREESGKRIVEGITGREDVEVLLDPTMLLHILKWDKILKKPKQIDELCTNNEKYILNYFLGVDSYNEERKREIERIARENNCKIINILDKNDPFYVCGPDEFVWLEKNAFLVCTDSFHSSVFAILYNVPFVVFNREDGQSGKNRMNTRLDTLLEKFDLKNRYYNGKITDDLLILQHSKIEEVLNTERRKAEVFLKKALK